MVIVNANRKRKRATKAIGGTNNAVYPCDFIDEDEFSWDLQPRELPKTVDFFVGFINWTLNIKLVQRERENFLNFALSPSINDQLDGGYCSVKISGSLWLKKKKGYLLEQPKKSPHYREFFYLFNSSDRNTYTEFEDIPIQVSKSRMVDSEYMQNGKFTLVISLRVRRIKKSYYKRFDFYRKSTESDVVLVVEEKKFHANKMILSVYSDYFQTMFQQQAFHEFTDREVRIDTDARSMFHFLSLIYPTGAVIEAKYLEKLLYLADYLISPYVTGLCQDFLIIDLHRGQFSLDRKLWLSDKFKLLQLKARVMQKMTTEVLDQISGRQFIEGLEDETLKMIIRRRSRFEMEKRREQDEERKRQQGQPGTSGQGTSAAAADGKEKQSQAQLKDGGKQQQKNRGKKTGRGGL